MTTLSILLVFCFALSGNAQVLLHQSGTINIRQVGDFASSLTLEATIVTYSNDNIEQSETIELCWGDGVCEMLTRVNGPGNPPQGELLEENLRKNVYVGFHTYPVRGTYVISTTNCCWIEDVVNIIDPENTEVFLFSEFTFPNPTFEGPNAQPIFLQPGIDVGLLNEVFTHNPNAYDVDGDSLSYAFYDFPNDNILMPDQILPGPDNNITINPVTGDIQWDSPQLAGRYILLIAITDYRDGIPKGKTIYTLNILIEDDVVSTYDHQKNAVQLFPNPATTKTNLQFDFQPDKNASIRLINTAGQSLRSWRIQDTAPKELNLSQIPAGFYWVEITQNGKTQTKPLVIFNN